MPSPCTDIAEVEITRLIVGSFTEDFLASTELDVAIVGAGPSGVTAARLLAAQGHRVAVFERNLHVGGGMWGGGMLFPRLVVEEEARPLLEEVGVRLRPCRPGYLVADAVECVTKCTAAALDAGAMVWVGMAVEDVMIDDQERVRGIVITWGAVQRAGLHVDPLGLAARVVIDATGHDCELVRTLERKLPGVRLDTPTGRVMGERPMHAARAEGQVVGLTKEIYPHLVVAGMAANAACAAPRMGAIFGGMFLSGRHAAQITQDILARDFNGGSK